MTTAVIWWLYNIRTSISGIFLSFFLMFVTLWLQYGCYSTQHHICFKKRGQKRVVTFVPGKHKFSQKLTVDIPFHVLDGNSLMDVLLPEQIDSCLYEIKQSQTMRAVVVFA